MSVTLRLLDRADSEIAKLPRNMRGAVWDFMHKFRIDPSAPGLRFKALKDGGGKGTGERLYSGRVTDDYRALLLHLGDEEYLLVSVKHRRDVYTNLDRVSYTINRVTGGIEYIDLSTVESRVNDTTAPSAEQGPAVAPAPRSYPLFAAYGDAQLLDLGVSPVLLPLIRRITTEGELEGLIEFAPQLTSEVLIELFSGRPVEEVLEYVTRPQATADDVDPEDYRAALDRPATIVSSEDEAVQGALGEGFARWQVFLHPEQRKLVERARNGPARVSGGPGTGKTIVALHRVRHLAARAPAGGKPILLTTYTKNLAKDLSDRLRELGGQELLDRVEVAHVDAVVSTVLNENGVRGARPIADRQVVEQWRAMLAELGEERWTPEFLAEEWTEVILGQAVNSRAAYFRVRRPGRGQLRRPDRDAIWQLVERFTKRLDDLGLTTFLQRAERAARLEMGRDIDIRAKAAQRDERGGAPNLHFEAGSGGLLRHRYRHVVVDEAQDLNPAHWMLLRAMVPPGPDDMFLVGDTHQRIYENQISLGSLGVNIRGRSARLTLSYRTTRQILGSAIGLLKGEVYDDLDGGAEALDGYRSILSGARPRLGAFRTWDEELDGVVAQIRAWSEAGEALSSIGVSAPTKDMVTDVLGALGRAGVTAVEIGREGGPRDAVRVGTMHRCKGLEFQHMCVTGIADGLLPRHVQGSAKQMERQRQRDRSLLFVAATRARDTLVITHHATPSPFLLPLRVD
ncbi:UvrD-like helicase family protein [Murinocardiopsis flavida]|uniref:DNA 3'-5' helicase n=1 Tax=Murinocardiopsis flavida TaxID=645275 RepID=A0A2P8DET1_9ACTN|nr:UvrD-helicase domain-containing protein [Murinocardiopsis flavida]PSK95736.1 UvrD-like helicase family protein [Murinocardiopsis flavida]